MKLCSKCKETKPYSEFCKQSQESIDGYQAWCKKCKAKYQRNWAKNIGYYHRPDVLEGQRRRRKRPEIKAHEKQYRMIHRATSKEKERRALYDKEYNQRPYVQEANRIRQRKYMRYPKVKEQRAHNQRRRHIRQNNAPGYHTLIAWREMCELIDFKCLKCGQLLPLSVDHIIPLTKGGCDCIENIQPLCKPCNSSKHTEITDYRPIEILNWLKTRSLDAPPCDHLSSTTK